MKIIVTMTTVVLLFATAPAATAKEGLRHQISLGLGLKTWIHAEVDMGKTGVKGSSFLPPDALWFDIPVIYRYRASPYFAAGGGLMPTVIKGEAGGTGGAHLVGSLRVYPVPDWFTSTST